MAPIATGAEAIDGAGVAAVALNDISEPPGVTGEPEIGCAGVAAAVAIGATATADGAVMSEAAGGTGRLAAGCGATAPEGLNVPNVVPVDEVAGLTGGVGAGAEGGAVIEPDATLTGVAVPIADEATGAGAGAFEPDVEADGLTVDGVTVGATFGAGVDARESEP